MKTYRIILKPKSIIEKFPSSETIFGAICWGINHLYDDVDLQKILNDFKNCDKKFIPSSAFPVLKSKNGDIYFYPRPIWKHPKIEDIENLSKDYESKQINENKTEKKDIVNTSQFAKKIVLSEYKKFERVNFVTESLFRRIVNGENTIKLYQDFLDKKIQILTNNFLITSEELKSLNSLNLIVTSTSARNKIDRISFSTVPGGEIYYQNEIYIDPQNMHLYFLLMTDDIEFFKPIFRWLEDTGIGGNRTMGRGFYDIKVDNTIELPNIENSNRFITLSKYLPIDNEINWDSEHNYYQLLTYQPRLDTMFFKSGEFIKDSVIYLKEGSILNGKEHKSYYGDLKPSINVDDKIIYQCGLTIPIFIKPEVSNETED